MSASAATRANVLSVYKRLLRLARQLPAAKRGQSVSEIREQFRANMGSASEDVAKLLEKANSSLGYLKIVTPRGRQAQGGVTKLVFGAAAGGSDPGRKAMTNWTGSNMDPDSVKRHQNILKRTGFKNNAEAKGLF
jgi:hypothetical protein